MTMVTIKNIRLSFVWTDTLPGLLDGLAPDASLSWLGRRGDYIYKFDLAQTAGSAGPGSQGVPWRAPDSGRAFWRYYFENKRVISITGNQAWKHLTPFREDLVFFAPEGEAFSELRVSGFYFSHGTALVATLNLRHQAITVLECAKRAMALRQDRTLTLPNEPGKRYSLDVLGNELRERLLETRFAGLSSHAGRNQPFSVVTVLEADDVDRLAVAVDGDEIHRALEAMTRWNPNFDVVDLAQSPIAESMIERSGKGLRSDLVYARKSGVAIWLPRQLNGGTEGRKSLSCYHNNILHGSVQVRSLAELIAFTKRETAQGAAASVGNKERSSRAATILGLMKAGKDVTYRSLCLSRQIEETLADF
jgi:hypothetical protein